MRVSLIIFIFSLWPISKPAIGCSTIGFAADSRCFMAKNYDWHLQHGMILANARNVRKTAFLLDPQTEKPKHWRSAHGSLTFNQYGQEFPLGGINDAGLAIEVMLLEETIYPPKDRKAAISELQWIQYHLDRWSTVKQMEKHSANLRISPIYANVHYLACDKTGDCATFEFLEGNLVARRNNELPYSVLTNDMYQTSLTELENYRNFGGDQEIPSGTSSLDRFVRAADFLRLFKQDKRKGLRWAFEALTSVRHGWHTKWSIVYDLKEQKIAFRSLSQPRLKQIDVKAFRFSCRTPVRAIDINTPASGDVTGNFVDYTDAMNREMLEISLQGLRGLPKRENIPELPEDAVERFARYPSHNRCREGLKIR